MNGDGGLAFVGGASGQGAGGVSFGGGVAATGGEASTGGGENTGGGANPGSGGGQNAASCRPDCGTHKWACWPMPNPIGSPDGTPNLASYEDNGDGTVFDELTCLTWEKANPASVGNLAQNLARCQSLADESFGGFADWRLPTRIEMASISDVTLGNTGFPSVFGVTSGYYLTGSDWYKTILSGGTEDRVWGYGTNGFTSNSIVKSDAGNVARCVRGNGPGEDQDEYAMEPPDHYSVGTETVQDNYTRLIWQRGYSPSLMDWSDAPAYCEALVLDEYDDFRVPTLNELATTVDEAQVGGAIITEAFPGNPEGCKEPQYWFWSAEASKVGGEGWGLSYCDGFTGWNAGAAGSWNYFPEANVRCVR